MVSGAWLFMSPKELSEHEHTQAVLPGGEGLHPPVGSTVHCCSAQN